MTRREISITVTLTIEGDAPIEAVLACLGTDMEDAIRIHHEQGRGAFGLYEDCDLVDWAVHEPTITHSNFHDSSACRTEQEHSPDEHGQCDDCGATVFNPALEPLKVLSFAGFDGGDAAGLADGWLECDNEHVIMAAWQYLHNSRIAYQLDGNFSRKCRELIAAGKIFDAL